MVARRLTPGRRAREVVSRRDARTYARWRLVGSLRDREHRALGTVVPRLVSNSGTSRQSNILQAYNPARRQGGTMCKVSRRELLIGGGAFLSLAAETDLLARPMPGMSQAAKEDLVASDVYFHEGDISDTA